MHHHEALDGLDPPPQSEVSQVYAPTESGGISSVASAEDTLVESINGEVFDVTRLTPKVDPRGRSWRNRVKTLRYSADWWVDNQGSDDEEDVVDNGNDYRASGSQKGTFFGIKCHTV